MVDPIRSARPRSGEPAGAANPRPEDPPGPRPVRVGVLSLQGDFALHRRSLAALGIEAPEVRVSRDLGDLDGLVLPGGESTTMLKLMEGTDLEAAIRAFHARGGALFGTCAGLILLARGVDHPPQRSLELLDVDVSRNGYGRQLDSFEADVPWDGDAAPMRAVFIRAPRITRVGRDVEVLAERGGEPLMVREGRILAATFHPEMTPDTRVHARFLDLVRAAVLEAGRPGVFATMEGR